LNQVKTLSVPGKLFLMGEYGVIEGGTAFVAALSPSYVFEADTGTRAHPESPWGRWSSVRVDLLHGVKPVGAGLGPGFGSSTAELIAGAAFYEGRLPKTQTLWSEYRERHPSASGADLAAQLESVHGSGSFFKIDLSGGELGVFPIDPPHWVDQVWVFRVAPGNKLKTHEDLERPRKPLDFPQFQDLMLRFEAACFNKSQEGLRIFDEFADFLHAFDRETESSHRIRRTLRQVRGVIGVKGCGAGLNDSFLVARDASAPKKEIMETAEGLGLHFLGSLKEVLA
jgi:hypothetical protein